MDCQSWPDPKLSVKENMKRTRIFIYVYHIYQATIFKNEINKRINAAPDCLLSRQNIAVNDYSDRVIPPDDQEVSLLSSI